MFDILDDNLNLTNLSISPGSRSASMKKIQKKQNRPSFFQQSKPNTSQNKEFDDLISGFLGKQSKNINQSNDSLSRTTSKKGKFDSLDLNFDDAGKFKPTTSLSNTVGNNFGRPLTAKNYNDFDAPHEEHKLSSHFGMTQQTIISPSRVQESFVSTRQMKPPIKRRQNVSYMSGNIFTNQMGMAIPEEDPTISNSSNDIYNPKPQRSVNRRSSIDSRSQVNIDQSFPLKNQVMENSMSFKMDKIKEEPLEKLSNTESHIIGWGHNDTGFKFGSNFNKNEVNSVISKEKPSEKSQKAGQSAITEAQINERINKSNKSLIYDYEKQIELMKANYEKRNQFLQESLDKQIAQNREMRENFLKETGIMLDQERARSKRIHEEEISRLKDMFEWQKKKISQTLKCEIDSLKSVIDFKKESSNAKTFYYGKYEQQNQEMKLKMWESSLQEKSHMLERRQNELQQKINQLNAQKRQEDERIRRQQRRLMQLQMNYKRQMLTQKKQIAEEKQKMSVQIGDLELDIIKRKQANEIEARKIQIERESVEREKQEVRKMNYEVMQTHKMNLQEIQQERQKISHIELQLLKKLRVVELKAQQAHISRNNQEQAFFISHELSKIKEKDKNYPPMRKISKESNTKSMSNLLKTKERFYEMESNARSKLNTSIKDHKRLDLGHYISRIEHFSKAKQ